VPTLRNINWRSKPLAASAHMAAVKYQLGRLSRHRPTAPGISPAWALLLAQADVKCRTRRYRRWIGARVIAH
ncbi:2,4-dienoyl-CoA reductase, partial [Stenotrophomonas geniculata]